MHEDEARNIDSAEVPQEYLLSARKHEHACVKSEEPWVEELEHSEVPYQTEERKNLASLGVSLCVVLEVRIWRSVFI